MHCYGVVELLDAAATRELMARMLDTFEPGLSGDTTLMPEAYMSRQLQGIVGFKIQLDDVQGKEKLGQHRSQEDQQGVFAALSASDRSDDRQLAEYMRMRGTGTGR